MGGRSGSSMSGGLQRRAGTAGGMGITNLGGMGTWHKARSGDKEPHSHTHGRPMFNSRGHKGHHLNQGEVEMYRSQAAQPAQLQQDQQGSHEDHKRQLNEQLACL